LTAPGARHAALLAGQIHYFTGKPCKRDHVARRWTLNATCIECVWERNQLPANRKKVAAYRASINALNRSYQRDYYAKNREKLTAKRRARYWGQP
jgi:hypothetical protein